MGRERKTDRRGAAVFSKAALPKAEVQAARHRQTREAHGSELAEDYVEVIHDLLQNQGEARAVEIARRLGVTHVTVTKTVARLQRDGLVTSRPYRSIFLTDAGAALAEQCKRRHEIVLEFLRALGVSESVAQLDAEGIEHHVSGETLRAFTRITRQLRA